MSSTITSTFIVKKSQAIESIGFETEIMMDFSAFLTYVSLVGPVIDKDVRVSLRLHQVTPLLFVVDVVQVALVGPDGRILLKSLHIVTIEKVLKSLF